MPCTSRPAGCGDHGSFLWPNFSSTTPCLWAPSTRRGSRPSKFGLIQNNGGDLAAAAVLETHACQHAVVYIPAPNTASTLKVSEHPLVHPLEALSCIGLR
jgi:hypothetical protein